MALYTDIYWEPSGAVASQATARVFPRFSTSLAPLFSDPAMTVPLANPTMTDLIGVLTFYAAPGDYWIHIRDLTFDVVIGDNFSWHAVVQHVQSAPASTWIIQHDLNAEPDVTVVTPAGVVAMVQTTFLDPNTVSLFFQAGPETGTAYLRR